MPDWYLNLVAHSRTIVEVGAGTLEVTARTAEGCRARAALGGAEGGRSRFAEYESQSALRQIPVAILEPTA
ncbi:MAG: nitroreductase family deazaflavin-dependent oxidoreductase [Acidimicrobiaceae bacterium]|nr:nitroreductase family deazaflavin-dependent oxidoreductase [Acidimicrobiaceae bacterium]